MSVFSLILSVKAFRLIIIKVFLSCCSTSGAVFLMTSSQNHSHPSYSYSGHFCFSSLSCTFLSEYSI